jgi:Mn-dependent DtxR family transcriptional regulator
MKTKYIQTLIAIKDIDFPRFPIRVLKERLGLKSNSPVLGRLNNLEEMGLIVRQNGAINLTSQGEEIIKTNTYLTFNIAKPFYEGCGGTNFLTYDT